MVKRGEFRPFCDRRKWTQIRRRYGMTKEQYETMAIKQMGLCASCGEPGSGERGSKLFIDHNHTTGLFRELLCPKCNWIAGLIEDKKFSLVMEYLKRHGRN